MQVSEAIESRLIELAMKSPTAFNLQHWRFVVVRNPERRRQIREVTGDQVTNASVPMPPADAAMSGDTMPNASGGTHEMMTGAIDACSRDRPEVERDEVMRVCGF